MFADDSSNKDEGINVRSKAKELVSLLQDTERLREERRRAKVSRNRFVGISSFDEHARKRKLKVLEKVNF